MNRCKNILLRSLVVSAGVLSAACERDDICPENTAGTPAAQVVFRTYDPAGEPIEYTPQGVHFYGLRGNERLEEISYSEGSASLQLFVDFESETTRYLIEQAGKSDTLTFHYEPELEFISKACGFRFVFSAMTARCTSEGPVSHFTADIEDAPAEGRLFDSRQTVATIYFSTQAQQP